MFSSLSQGLTAEGCQRSCMEQEKGFTQQQSVKPVCYPRASLVSRPLEKTCPALPWAPAPPHCPTFPTGPWHPSAPGAATELHTCPNLWLWGTIYIHGGFVSPGAQAESDLTVLLVCVVSWLQLCPTSGRSSLQEASLKNWGACLSLGICASSHRNFSCKPSHMIQRNKHLFLWWSDVSLLYI